MAPQCAAFCGLLLLLSLANVPLSCCHSVRGSVACLGCSHHKNLTGMRIAVKCRNESKYAFALTNSKGHFKAKMPANSSSPSLSRSPDCFAMLLGGPVQLWAFRKSMVSKIVKARGPRNSYALATPLRFFISCPSETDQRPDADVKMPDFDLSDGFGFLPMLSPSPAGDGADPAGDGSDPAGGETGGMPLIFFFPFIPIIGIP